MTYCVAVKLDSGLVMASDSRTHAGVDHVSSFRKMTVFERAGERVLVLLSSGNLAITQGVVGFLEQRRRDGAPEGLMTANSMFAAASVLGDALRQVQQRDAPYLAQSNIDSSASFLFGGQIVGEPPRLFHIYAEGNFIEATPETPFFQIGETKYAKPILDRVITSRLTLTEAAKCVLLSIDSAMRSNLSVGPPIDLLCYERDALSVGMHRRIAESDGYLDAIREQWGRGLLRVFAELPDPYWEHGS